MWEMDECFAAYNIAEAERVRSSEQVRLVLEWISKPDVITPFPWLGSEQLTPCNLAGITCYARMNRFPPGV